jgi:MFS family permease
LKINRDLFLVAVSLSIWGIGEGLFIYFQPIYLQEWVVDPVLIGTILGGMGVAMAVAQIPAGYLSDRFGSRSIMWASWVLGTVAAWAMALANSAPAFIVGLLLYGMTGFVMAPMNSYVATVRGNFSVGRALTFVSGLYNLGAVIGPLVGGLLAEKLGLRSVYIAAGILFIFSTIIVLFVSKHPQPHHQDQEATQPKGLLTNTRFLSFLGVTLITILVLYLPYPFTPNFLKNQQGLPEASIGIMGSFASLGNAVAVLVFGSLRPMLAFMIGQVWVLACTLFFLKGNTSLWFGLGYFFLGGMRLSKYMILAITRSLIHPAETGLAYGMVETASSVAMILAPVLAGALYKEDPWLIYEVPAYAIAAVMILNLLILRAYRRKQTHAPAL